jgi:hypothetical protein
MTTPLLRSPINISHASALQVSQQAPLYLEQSSKSSFPIPFLSQSEKEETWIIYENLLLSCLRTGDDQSARICLQRLSDRFGADNPRVLASKGLYEEATAEGESDLKKILSQYDKLLEEDPTNWVSIESFRYKTSC